MRTLGLALGIALLGTAASAETLVFEADGGVVFTRCSAFPFSTSCEIIFPAGTMDDAYACIALDADGAPIGVATGPNFMTPVGVWFPELAASQIANVRCRLR